LAFDAINTYQDATYSGSDYGLTPTLAADLRYPLSKVATDGTTYILEPVAQIAWSGGHDLDAANEESTRIAFDEGNLLSLSRCPAEDRVERGVRAAYGLNWSRVAKDKWSANFTFAQVIHAEADSDFTVSSGLGGIGSVFLLAGQLKTTNGFALTARGLFDGVNGVNKVAARASWRNTKL